LRVGETDNSPAAFAATIVGATLLFGASVAACGDLDGDGVPDYVEMTEAEALSLLA
jgi:hypothetical protein